EMKEKVEKVFLQWRRTKIIATIGPASDSERMIKKLIRSGVDAFRLNMSHGNHQQHKDTFELIRKVTSELGRHLPILMDLCGPKLRVGRFKSGEITLKKNSKVIITCRKVMGEKGVIPSQVKNLYQDIKVSERVLLDDGNMELSVEKIHDQDIYCTVIHGGILKDNKGINLPDTAISLLSPTAKDKRDVKLAMQLGADFVALSFVRSAKDILNLKRFMIRTGYELPVIAKIERPEAVENIETIKEILAASYGVMIARGDLGIELPAERVPLIQKKLITLARYYHRPVIVATQMMESMIEHSRPTRAEVADVANAALNSTDAVMLSAETAVGKYPAETVKNMDRILREIELHQWQEDEFSTIRELSADFVKEN
ncbi:MAG: pyruvate kinase, partial [Gammaproteobacteria bacterium]|nr:pyruvate kinase [Gammaproteobacteria bacterium]